ncbi:MAG: PilZ domain-containing protein [Phycisphaerae bacterium]|nr:PilZ domain-containing protein [Phycisphaerae bacterium]
MARLTHLGDDGREEQVDNVTHQVLDVSDGSVAIHSYRKIVPGTRLAVDMNVGDRRLRLLGKVIRCAGNLGTVRVGIALEFGASDDKEAADGG